MSTRPSGEKCGLSTGPGKTRARLGIILIFLAFFGPLGLAAWLYFGGWQPAGTVNHGELVLPPGDVSEVVLEDLDGQPLPEVTLTGRWSVVLVPAGRCDQLCTTDLYNTRQARLALGKEMDRVQRILLLTGGRAAAPPGPWQSAHPDLTVARRPVAEPLSHPGYILIVDPLGNMMMRYAAGYSAKGMLEDLKRLLKLSEIG